MDLSFEVHSHCAKPTYFKGALLLKSIVFDLLVVSRWFQWILTGLALDSEFKSNLLHRVTYFKWEPTFGRRPVMTSTPIRT